MRKMKNSELKKFALENNVPIIRDNELKWLMEYIQKNNVKTIFEIGSAIGYSALNFCSISEQIKVDTIEYNKERFELTTRNIEGSKQINAIYGDALEFDHALLKYRPYDMIFLDGPKSSFLKQVEIFKHYSSDDGVFIIDNIFLNVIRNNPEKMQDKRKRRMVEKIDQFLDVMQNSSEFQIEIVDIEDGIAILKRR